MKDLTKKTIEDLKKLLVEKREALRTFTFGLTGSKTRNLKEGKNLRKEIARILTAVKANTLK